MVNFCGGQVVYADHLDPANLFALTADSYIRAATPRTKAVIVNSPSNPTGMVMKADELARLIRHFAGSGVLVVVDDCYRRILYGGDPYPSPLALVPEARDRVAVVASLSKSFAMTGWRLGYTIAPAPLAAAMTKIQEHSTSNPSSISQKAAVEALLGPQDEVERMVAEYRRRRDFFARRVDEIGHIAYRLPDGAFYFFADFSHWIRRRGLADDNALSMDILEKLGIILVPGSAFGAPNYLRISYATAMADIEEGLRRIEAYLHG
jgi:aspartate aminotransferase